jgi:hypothetical protein
VPRISVPEKQLVASVDEMLTSIFALHMTHRHHDSLGGLNYLPDDLDEYVESCYRIFHDRLHETRVDLDHEHEDS